MASHSIDVFSIAKQQICLAIELFDSGNWICAMTLAVAAEGVLQKYFEEREIETNFKKIRSAFSTEYDVPFKEVGRYMKRMRDMVIHGTIPKDGIEFSDQEVFSTIATAISDYSTVTESMTVEMAKFAKKYSPIYS